MTISKSKLESIKKYGENMRLAFVGGNASRSYQMRTVQYKLQLALKKSERTDFINTLFPVADFSGMKMPDFLLEYVDNDANYKACAYAFLMGLSTPDEIKEAPET